MSDLDSRIAHAVAIAEQNDRCGTYKTDIRMTQASICLLRKGHTIPHKYEDVCKVIPF